MSEENIPEEVKENVEEALARGNEVVPEEVKEVPKEMPPKKTPPAPTITNPEPVENTPKVNKKLSAMSKNTKEKQKNRRLSKPTTVSRAPSKGFSLDINPMYLFGLLGVIIAAASLWYQRKSFLKEEEDDSGPVQSSGGETETKKQSPPPKKKSLDPWAYQHHQQQTGPFGSFPGNYDFD